MKSATNKTRWLRSWLPWHAFDGMGLDWRAHRDNVRDMSPRDIRYNALVLLAIALVIATCAAAYAVPRFSLLIDLAGGIVIASVVLVITGQWQELRRGLQETGYWPTAGVQLVMVRHYILTVLLQAQDHRRRYRVAERGRKEGEGAHE